MRIDVEGLSFGYGSHRILEDIDLVLDGPGLVCIIGPNGVGKSTLVKCIDGLLKPDSGRILIDGRDISDMGRSELADRIAYVPATGMDCFSMPVMDSILVGRSNRQKWRTSKKDLRIVNDAMKLMGIEDLAMHGCNELSAGQHQKVALARGIVQETDIMVLDEPTANLDVRHQIYVTQMLRTIADTQGKLIVMICHDLNIAARYATKIIAMAPPGIIDRVGTASEVIREDVIRRIYDIDCEVTTYEGRPLVILKSTFGDGDRLVNGPERSATRVS